jgi:hypothetical protein
MSKLVNQCEYLSLSSIDRVDEDERRILIAEGKAAELLDLEWPASIVSNDAAAEDADANAFDPLNDVSHELIGTDWPLMTRRQSKRATYSTRRNGTGCRTFCLPDHGDRIGAAFAELFGEPRLLAHRRQEQVTKVNTDRSKSVSVDSSKVRDG